ncbi:MAG: ATP-binding cassette domain-containing protein [Truepera sp.]|nr:ATP-binding cassette domain-containing protein [Truepera sp.]
MTLTGVAQRSHPRVPVDVEVTAAAPSTGPQPSVVVTLKGLTVGYVRSGFSLQLPALRIVRGERVALVGPSGSGKTTLLRVVNGRVPIERGELELFGCPVTTATLRGRSLRRRIGFIFQTFQLVERATVFENILWGRLSWRSTLPSLFSSFSREDRLQTEEVICEVGLEAQALQRVSDLSGGQQQRVGIARALVQEPDLILADEPVSNLDPETAGEIMQLLERVCNSRRVTLMMSLHQPDLARRHASRIITLEGGRLVDDRSNPEALIPRTGDALHG